MVVAGEFNYEDIHRNDDADRKSKEDEGAIREPLDNILLWHEKFPLWCGGAYLGASHGG